MLNKKPGSSNTAAGFRSLNANKNQADLPPRHIHIQHIPIIPEQMLIMERRLLLFIILYLLSVKLFDCQYNNTDCLLCQ